MQQDQQRGGIHPRLTRRTAVQAGAIGLLGLGLNHLDGLRAADVRSPQSAGGRAKALT
jgi:hypothetical protein